MEVLVSRVEVLVSRVVVLVNRVVVLDNNQVDLDSKAEILVDLEIKEEDNLILDNKMDKILVDQLLVASLVGDNREALITKVEEVTKVVQIIILHLSFY